MCKALYLDSKSNCFKLSSPKPHRGKDLYGSYLIKVFCRSGKLGPESEGDQAQT